MVKLTIEQVKQAADVLEEISRIYNYHPQEGTWSAEELRYEIPHLEEHFQQAEIVQEISDAIADRVLCGDGLEIAVTTVLGGYAIRRT